MNSSSAVRKRFFAVSRSSHCPADFFPALRNELVYVPMNDLAVISAADERQYIGTSDLSSCAALAIYDAQQKVGGVAHISFNPEVEGFITKVSGFRFSRFSDYAHRLVARADKEGGNRYNFYAFNIKYGSRTKEQNLQLGGVVEQTIAELTDKGKLIDSQYRNETTLLLSMKSGTLMLY